MKFTANIFFTVKSSEFPKPKTQPDMAVHLKNTDQLLDEGRFDEGLAYIAGLFNRLSKGRDNKIYGYLKLSQGICYRKMAFFSETAENLVKGIAAFEEALGLFKDSDWEFGTTQLNLGAALVSLAEHQEREENLSKAFNAFEKAKAVLEKAVAGFGRNKSSNEYPLLSLYLGAAYNYLADFQDRERNLNQGLKVLQDALPLINQEQTPSISASLQFQLGYGFSSLADSQDSAANYQKSIQAYEGALQVYNLQSYPVEYSHTLNSLANVYIDLARLNNEEANLNKAMEICKEVLNALNSTAEYPLGYAFILHNLGSACKLYSKIRNKGFYLDKAVRYFEMIFEIENLSPTSEIVASTHLNLGVIHNIIAAVRERDQHLSKAVAEFEKALRIYDARQNTLRRSITLTNLGQTYMALAENDDSGENLHKAVAAFQEGVRLLDPRINKSQFIEASIYLGMARLRSAQNSFHEDTINQGIRDFTAALQVCNPEEMPVFYEKLQIGLGEAYQFLGLTKRQADYFGKAIEALEGALKVVGGKQPRLMEAEVLKNLGFAYCDFAKVIGKETNLQKGEKYFRDAQRIMDLDHHPLEFAALNEALAETYVERSGINQKEHYLKLAIKTLEETAPILTVTGSQEQSSRLQSRLGELYRSLAEVIDEIGPKKEAYRKSIASYETALKYFTIDRFPKEFADNTFQIGITYKMMAETIKNMAFNSISEYNEFRADRLLNAMGAFQGALLVFTIDKYPYDFAMVQFYIGESYAMLAELQDREENLARALTALEESLKVYSPTAYPNEHKKAIYFYEKVKHRI